MKKLVLCTLLIGLIGVQNTEAQKKEFKEQIKKEVAFGGNGADNLLVIKNVFGNVEVEGYGGSTVVFEVERTIRAKNTEDLELGKRELQLKIREDGNKIIAHPDAPYIKFDEEGMRFNWCDNHEEPPYSHNLNFKVKLPKNTSLEVSTINDGEVIISNTKGKYLNANNINGGIELANVSGRTDVHCINGEVKISYSENPKGDSNYYSLNGDINISYQKGLSAEIGFKSMNGELYTDFEIAKQFTKTSKNTANKKGKFKYEAKPIVQIGSGGLSHNFETLNGNVIITKI